MRLLECALILLQAGILLALILLHRPLKAKRWAGLMLWLLFLCHGLFEGVRWQMSGVYCLVPVLFLLCRNDREPRFKRPLRIIGYILLLGLLTLSASATILLPIPDLPQPSGNCFVGVHRMSLTDSLRQEPFTADSSDHRTLFLTVRYPADDVQGLTPKAYWSRPKPMSRAWASAYGMEFAPFIWSHLGSIRSASHVRATAAPDTFPVILFSHGYWQAPVFNQILMEELASRGYVVIGIAHSHETPFALNHRGEVVPVSRRNNAFLRRMNEGRDPELGRIMQQLENTEEWNAQLPLYRRFYELQPAWTESHHLWRDDMRFVLDQLPRIAHAVKVGIDVNRAGVMGFSFGGSAAGQTSLMDARVSAGVNLDAWQSGHDCGRNLRVPFLFFVSQGHEGHSDFFIEQARGPVFELMLKKSRHANFNDMAYLAPTAGRLMQRLGAIHPARGHEIVRRHVVSFFDTYLKGSGDFLSLIQTPDDNLLVRKRK